MFWDINNNIFKNEQKGFPRFVSVPEFFVQNKFTKLYFEKGDPTCCVNFILFKGRTYKK